MKTEHGACPSYIRRTFEGPSLEPREDTAMREHLRGCEACRAIYERYAAAEASLHPKREGRGMSPAQLDRVQKRLFPGQPAKARIRRRGAVVGLGLAAAGAMAVVLSFPQDESFRARGGVQAPVDPRVSIRAVRLRPEGATWSVSDLATDPQVFAGDQVAVLVSHRGGFERVDVSLRDPEHGRRIVSETSVASEALDEKVASLQVEPTWTPGTYVVEARFRNGGEDAIREISFDLVGRP